MPVTTEAPTFTFDPALYGLAAPRGAAATWERAQGASFKITTASAKGRVWPPPVPEVPRLGHVHVQGTAATHWVIVHGLTFRPNVTVVDSAGASVEGDVEYLDDHTVRVKFSGAFSGTAYLS